NDMAAMPGSMGAASYIVEGQGNSHTVAAAPHGAGRQYSRRAALRNITQQDVRDGIAGIQYCVAARVTDETPQANKATLPVMQDSRELVTIRHTLRQIVNVKGE